MKRSPMPRRRKPMKSSSGANRSRRAADVKLRAAKEATRLRSEGMCEARTVACDGQASQAHHILRRSQGGQHDATNLLDVCWMCHSYIHEHPAESYENGWLRRR